MEGTGGFSRASLGLSIFEHLGFTRSGKYGAGFKGTACTRFAAQELLAISTGTRVSVLQQK